jgi:hypothetical protein
MHAMQVWIYILRCRCNECSAMTYTTVLCYFNCVCTFFLFLYSVSHAVCSCTIYNTGPSGP